MNSQCHRRRAPTGCVIMLVYGGDCNVPIQAYLHNTTVFENDQRAYHQPNLAITKLFTLTCIEMLAGIEFLEGANCS